MTYKFIIYCRKRVHDFQQFCVNCWEFFTEYKHQILCESNNFFLDIMDASLENLVSRKTRQVFRLVFGTENVTKSEMLILLVRKFLLEGF